MNISNHIMYSYALSLKYFIFRKRDYVNKGEEEICCWLFLTSGLMALDADSSLQTNIICVGIHSISPQKFKQSTIIFFEVSISYYSIDAHCSFYLSVHSAINDKRRQHATKPPTWLMQISMVQMNYSRC